MRWLLSCSLAGFFLLPSTFAQQVFRSGTQVVEVDARVFDEDGNFVTDLTRDDFEILEDGVPQPLVALTLVSAPTAATAPTPPPSTDTTVPPEGHVPTTARQTWIFFFDVNHLTPGANFGRARDAAAAFVRDRFREGDMAGVIDGSGMVNGRLTSVREEVVKAIEGVKPNPDAQSRMIQMTREWPRLLDEDEAIRIVDNNRDALEAAVCRATQDRTGQNQCSADDEPPVREKARMVVDQMQRPTMETLQTIDRLANGLARMTGPKTIVFISNGFVAAGMDGPLRSIVGQMARAGGRVYSIDARGLGRFGSGDNLGQAAATNEAGAMMSFDTQADGFNSLAVDTGGMMIRNQNNFNEALDTIAADANQYYVIGYQPTNTAYDGKYRSIEVRVKRPDVRVRARRGYLALEPAQMLAPRPLPPVAAADTAAPAPGLPAPAPPEAFGETVPEVGTPPDPSTAAEGSAPAGGGATSAVIDAPDESAYRLRPDEATRVRTLSEATGGLEEGNADAEAREAWDAYQRGDLEAALPLFLKASMRPDVAPWALYALGLTQAGMGNPEGAIAAWQRVRAAAPDYAAVYNDLAATYAAQGRLSDALAMLRDAEKRWPADAEIQNGIGVILVRREAYDEAIEAFTKATQAAPEEPVTHLNLGRAYELRYTRNLRFVASQRRWIGPENDRKRAVEAYNRCIELGGPYARRASAALSRLEWNSRDRR